MIKFHNRVSSKHHIFQTNSENIYSINKNPYRNSMHKERDTLLFGWKKEKMKIVGKFSNTHKDKEK
jgi:hypothetical protein